MPSKASAEVDITILGLTIRLIRMQAPEVNTFNRRLSSTSKIFRMQWPPLILARNPSSIFSSTGGWHGTVHIHSTDRKCVYGNLTRACHVRYNKTQHHLFFHLFLSRYIQSKATYSKKICWESIRSSVRTYVMSKCCYKNWVLLKLFQLSDNKTQLKEYVNI